MIKGRLEYNLPVIITKQSKRFVAYTPALDIATSGKTQKEVKKRFTELANIFLEEIFEAGTAREVLSELGWRKEKKSWIPPKIISASSVGLSLPVMA